MAAVFLFLYRAQVHSGQTVWYHLHTKAFWLPVKLHLNPNLWSPVVNTEPNTGGNKVLLQGFWACSQWWSWTTQKLLLLQIGRSKWRGLEHVIKMSPGVFLLVLYQTHLAGSRPSTDLGPAGEIISHSWLENMWRSLWRSWNLWLGIKKSGLTYLACCHHEPHQEKYVSNAASKKSHIFDYKCLMYCMLRYGKIASLIILFHIKL